LLRLVGEGRVDIGVYDVSGRLIREVYEGEEKNGKYTQAEGLYRYKVWDGTDDKGNMMPPGVYLFRISVSTDAGRSEEVGTVGVIY